MKGKRERASYRKKKMLEENSQTFWNGAQNLLVNNARTVNNS